MGTQVAIHCVTENRLVTDSLKGLSTEIVLAESDINLLVSIKGRGAEIFS
jgi:hypothetical protein